MLSHHAHPQIHVACHSGRKMLDDTKEQIHNRSMCRQVRATSNSAGFEIHCTNTFCPLHHPTDRHSSLFCLQALSSGSYCSPSYVNLNWDVIT
jgi:hypothetical protein